MTRRLLIALLCLLPACHKPTTGVSGVSVTAVSPIQLKKLRLGVPSYGHPEMIKTWHQLADGLSRKLGIDVEIRTAEPYTELPRLLAQKRVDIAEIPPLAYVRLLREQPELQAIATPVISGSPTYLGHIWVREAAAYQTIEDLKGARVGYVDKGSSSGYLFARDLIRRHGFNPDEFFASTTFYNSHEAVLAAVTSGKVDVGAAIDVTSGWSGLLNRPAGLRVVAKTERIPNDCMVAREGLDAAAIQAVQGALLSMHVGDPEARALLTGLHVNGWVKADEARYDRVRAVLSREGME